MKLKNLYRDQNLFWFIVDLSMLALVSLHFVIIILNWLFDTYLINTLLLEYVPPAHTFLQDYLYKPFLFYDLLFVSIYLGEITLRWAWAIYQRSYERWYFYPFIHWYDVLGCLPFESFRILRFLRFFAILYRLQQYEVIDFTQTYLYRKVIQIFEIFVEEVSDRVIVNVINGIQTELKDGHPVTGQILENVVEPEKQAITEWLAQRLRHTTALAYQEHRETIKSYLYERVTESVDRNWEVSLIDRFPILGGVMTQMLQDAVADIVFRTIDRVISDLATDPHNNFLDELTAVSFDALLSIEEDPELKQIIDRVFQESLEEIKSHVKIKQWKLKLEHERSTRNAPAIPE
ncbi:MAG: hypothetical protein ACFCUI_12070 [Bernardetiaceae bacterium]